MFERTEEVFDQVAFLVEFAVIITLFFAVGLGRDDGIDVCLGQRGEDAFVGVKGPVGKQLCGGKAWQQRVGAFEIVSLPGRQVKAGRITQRIDSGMDLGAQPSLAASDGLLLPRAGGAFFVRRRCADGREQWSNRSSRTRCPPLRRDA